MIAAVTELFAFLDNELTVVDVRSAEALKYACNAFHATKVSFANEMARVFKSYGVDSREVMKVFVRGHASLNVSPAYLMPGLRLRRLVSAEGSARAARHGPAERRWTSRCSPARCTPTSWSSPTSSTG